MKYWRLIRLCLLVLPFILLSARFAYAQGFAVDFTPIELKLRPGEKYVGFVYATNQKKETVHLKVYLGDWRQTEKGAVFLKLGEEPQSLSKWMRVSPAQLTIPPGGSEKVYFEIAMPEDPDLSGSYWGVFFVEGQPQSTSLESGQAEGPTVGITSIFRFGIKAYVTIPGTEIRQATFPGAKVSPVKGGFDMTATLENQGNIYLKPYVWLELRDQTGITVYSEAHLLKTVLPKSKRDYTFELRKLNLPPGRYTALIIADYDAPNLIAAQAEIEVKGK